MRDSVIGLIATFLIIGGDIIGWVAIAVMVFCIHSAVVCARCSKKRNKIGTRKEAVLKTDSLFSGSVVGHAILQHHNGHGIVPVISIHGHVVFGDDDGRSPIAVERVFSQFIKDLHKLRKDCRSAKLGNNRCISSGSGKEPWYPCPTMPISVCGFTINNLHSRLRCAVLSDSRRSPSK